MAESRACMVASVPAVCALAARPLIADFRDDFYDGQYSEDPNAWDIDDPCWGIYDPNHPADADYATQDPSTVLYLTMGSAGEIETGFKRDGGAPPFVAIVFMALAGLRMRLILGRTLTCADLRNGVH